MTRPLPAATAVWFALSDATATTTIPIRELYAQIPDWRHSADMRRIVMPVLDRPEPEWSREWSP